MNYQAERPKPLQLHWIQPRRYKARTLYWPLQTIVRGGQIKTQENRVGLELLSALSGVMIAIQSRINGELSHRLGDSLEAAMVSFGTGLIFVTLIVVLQKRTRSGFGLIIKAVKQKSLPKWRLGAGVLGASFVAMQTHVVPIAGVALFTVASLAGQTAISLFVDKLGLSGGAKSEITKRRIIAAAITILAVVVSAWDRFSMSNFSVVAIVLAILAGTWVGVQRALNAQINVYSTQSFATSLLNFITGTTFLLTLLIIRYLNSGQSLSKLIHAPWWVYLGGSIGVIYIAFSATAVQHMGVLVFTLFSVGGMLIGSLIIDLVAPTSGTDISWYLIAGILLTYVGVIANGQSRFSRR